MAETNDTPPATLDGARIWFVTDGTAEAGGWSRSFTDALRAAGAAAVDVLGVSGMLGVTARGLIGQGADKLARTLRLARAGEPDAPAIEAIRRGRPDLVIVDHPGVLRTLEIIRDTTGVSVVHVAVVTAPGAPAEWDGARADAYVAPDRETLARLRRPRMADIAFQIAGPPVPEGFDRDLDREALRKELGFDDATVVLVDASSMAPELIDRVVVHFGTAGEALRPVFYYGRNAAAADALRHFAVVHGVRADMFGHVDAYEEYAVTADLVVVGPDSALVSGYLAFDRPVVALDVGFAASEWARTGAVVSVGDPTALGDLLMRVAATGVDEAHAQAARDALGPRPTAEVAEAIGRIWAARDTVRGTSLSLQSATSTSSEAARSGRFEQIGAGDNVDPDIAPLSRAAAKEQLAALILDERRVEAEVGDLGRERDRWFERVALAEEETDADLGAFASEQARALTQSIARLNERLSGIQRQKELVRRRAAAGQKAPRTEERTAAGTASVDYETRFRELERRRDIRRLRERAGEGES